MTIFRKQKKKKTQLWWFGWFLETIKTIRLSSCGRTWWPIYLSHFLSNNAHNVLLNHFVFEKPYAVKHALHLHVLWRLSVSATWKMRRRVMNRIIFNYLSLVLVPLAGGSAGWLITYKENAVTVNKLSDKMTTIMAVVPLQNPLKFHPFSMSVALRVGTSMKAPFDWKMVATTPNTCSQLCELPIKSNWPLRIDKNTQGSHKMS